MLTEWLKQARIGRGLSRTALAKMTDLDPQVIKRLERGVGDVAKLTRLMHALELHLAKVGKGEKLYEQLGSARLRQGWSLSETARRSGLSARTIAAIEGGRGTMVSVIRLLDTLAPKAAPRRPAVRVPWQFDPQAAQRNVRLTPPDYMVAVRESFGEISLDPCAHANSFVGAKRNILLEAGGDGLTDIWSGDLVFMNPPFSALIAWLRRALDQWSKGHVDRVVALVPARLDSKFIHDDLAGVADIWIHRGRMRFALANREFGPQAPFGMMTIFLGCAPNQVAVFTGRTKGAWFAPRTWVHQL